MSFPTLKAELAEILKTRFWGEYMRWLADERDKKSRELENIGTDIGEPMTYGVVLQRIIWYLDRLAAFPARLVAEE